MQKQKGAASHSGGKKSHKRSRMMDERVNSMAEPDVKRFKSILRKEGVTHSNAYLRMWKKKSKEDTPPERPNAELSDSGHTSSFASEDELGFSSDSEAENIFMYDSFIDPHLESEDELDCLSETTVLSEEEVIRRRRSTLQMLLNRYKSQYYRLSDVVRSKHTQFVNLRERMESEGRMMPGMSGLSSGEDTAEAAPTDVPDEVALSSSSSTQPNIVTCLSPREALSASESSSFTAAIHSISPSSSSSSHSDVPPTRFYTSLAPVSETISPRRSKRVRNIHWHQCHNQRSMHSHEMHSSQCSRDLQKPMEKKERDPALEAKEAKERAEREEKGRMQSQQIRAEPIPVHVEDGSFCSKSGCYQGRAPASLYCINHILEDKEQVLFVKCSGKKEPATPGAASLSCEMPALPATMGRTPLCADHSKSLYPGFQ